MRTDEYVEAHRRFSQFCARTKKNNDENKNKDESRRILFEFPRTNQWYHPNIRRTAMHSIHEALQHCSLSAY